MKKRISVTVLGFYISIFFLVLSLFFISIGNKGQATIWLSAALLILSLYIIYSKEEL